MKANPRILVIGLGRLGQSLVRHLFEEKAEVIALDTDLSNVESVKDFCHLSLQGDGSDMETLVEVGAGNVDAAVICMGESFESSVLALTNLLELKVPRIEMRASTALKAKIYKNIGAHNVFYVEEEMGKIVAHRISRPAALHAMDLEYGLKIIEWSPPEWAQNKSLLELNFPNQHQIQVIAVRDPQQPRVALSVTPETVLKRGQLAIIMGEEKELQKLLGK